MWLAVQVEVQDEADKMKQAMEISLAEQEAARVARAAAPPLANLSEQRLRKKFKNSALLHALQPLLPGSVLFSDRAPLREMVKHKVGRASIFRSLIWAAMLPLLIAMCCNKANLKASLLPPLTCCSTEAAINRPPMCCVHKMSARWCHALQLVDYLRLEADCCKWWPGDGTDKFFNNTAGAVMGSTASALLDAAACVHLVGGRLL